MNKEIKVYLKAEAILSAAFSFFIGGMIAALIYHKADIVPTNALSLGIDLVITCLLTFALNTFFCRASLKRTKTMGILSETGLFFRLLGRLFARPAAFIVVPGLVAAMLLCALFAPVFALLGIQAMPFGAYMVFKTVSCAILSGGCTLLCLVSGMAAKK